MGKMETLYAEISDILDSIEDKIRSLGQESLDTNELENHVMELKDLLRKQRIDYIVSRQCIITFPLSLQVLCDLSLSIEQLLHFNFTLPPLHFEIALL